jgi:hypothetical protein
MRNAFLKLESKESTACPARLITYHFAGRFHFDDGVGANEFAPPPVRLTPSGFLERQSPPAPLLRETMNSSRVESEKTVPDFK